MGSKLPNNSEHKHLKERFFSSLKGKKCFADKMTQRVKALAFNPDDVNLVPRIHMVEEDN